MMYSQFSDSMWLLAYCQFPKTLPFAKTFRKHLSSIIKMNPLTSEHHSKEMPPPYSVEAGWLYTVYIIDSTHSYNNNNNQNETILLKTNFLLGNDDSLTISRTQLSNQYQLNSIFDV